MSASSFVAREVKMRGLELSERYFLECGLPMLRAEFPSLLPHLSAGLLGSGSECFGYDDEISRDHDFEPGFCLLLPEEDVIDRRTAFRLERAYAALPREFLGYRRAPLSPVGGNRHGVLRLADLLLEKTGTPDGRLSPREWLSLPEQSLAEVTNGRVFHDGSGALTEVRRRLSYLPEDVRLKRLAGYLLLSGQAGQYNYGRSLLRGDLGAAQLAASEFVRCVMHVIFLLNFTYIPYYKWRFRALSALPILGDLADPLYELIASGNGEAEAARKTATTEEVVRRVTAALAEGGLSDRGDEPLEAHAHAVNALVRDAELRNLHILYGV